MNAEPSDIRRHRSKYSAKIGRKRVLPSLPRSRSWSSPKFKSVSSPKRSKIYSSPNAGSKIKTKLASKFSTMQDTSRSRAKTVSKPVTPVREDTSVKSQIRVSPRTLEKQSQSTGTGSKQLDAVSSSKTPPQSGKKNVKMAVATTPHTHRRQSIMGRTPGRSTAPNHTPAPTTPYRTPRRISVDKTPFPDMKDAEKRFHENSAEYREELSGLLNKTMKVSNLSSMNNFFYQKKKLRTSYEKELKNKISQSYPLPMLQVSLVTSSCLRYSAECVDAVRITVTSVVYGSTPENDHVATIYIAWLFHSNHIQTSKFNNSWFPVMLHTGREKVHNIVIDWLQGAFGCYIAKTGIHQWDLMWMIGVWSGRSCPNTSHKDNNHQVSLTYHIRPPVDHPQLASRRGKPRMVMRLPLKEVRHIWETIVVGNKDEIILSQLKQFFACMDRIAADFLKLPTSYLNITTFITPCMSLSADGKVRLTCRRGAWYVLHHLSQIFIRSTTCFAFKEYFKKLLVDDRKEDSDDDEEEEEDEEEDLE